MADANTPTAGPLDMLPADDSPALQLLRLGLSWDNETDVESVWSDYPDGITCTVPKDGSDVTFMDMDTRVTRTVAQSGLKDITKVITWRTSQQTVANQ